MKLSLYELVAKWQELSYNKVVANGSALIYRDCATELEAALAQQAQPLTDEMVRVGAELHWFIETGHRNFSQLSEAAQGQRLDTMRAALEAALESISA